MLVKESLSRDVLRLIVWYPLRWLIKAIPVKQGLAVFRTMGDIHSGLSENKRNVVIRNLKTVLGDKLSDHELSGIAANYFRNHYVNQLQIFLFPKLNRNNLEKIHRFKGLENLDQALKKGNGCILLHPHFGPAQLPLCALGILGYPVIQLGLPTDEGLSFVGRKVAFRLRMKYEGKIPAKIIMATSFLRPVMECLQNNGVLMMTGDGAGGGKFVGKFIPVKFLGKNVLFPLGAATLAQKKGAPLLPMFTIMKETGGYETIIHKPINLASNGQDINPVEANTAKFARLMEDYVYKYPYLWHFWDEMENRLLSSQPKGEITLNEIL
ncbi:MAG: lysophospholipid acyltransferase family protein [Candidatus Schekmanbacteria bacterium]|nr:lysophospholipid acyltransferase family protein [Candidatus Schekmanbacteria bacterium]